jgi:hypothetical protein
MNKSVAITALVLLVIFELYFTYVPVATLLIVLSVFVPDLNKFLVNFLTALGNLKLLGD